MCIVQERLKRATVGPLPGVTQDIAGFKVIFVTYSSFSFCPLLVYRFTSSGLCVSMIFEHILRKFCGTDCSST